MLIDCSTCAMQHTAHCDGCIVHALMEPAPRRGDAMVMDADEERALRELAKAGLIPEIRMKPRRRSA
jgi:hypothetical protein